METGDSRKVRSGRVRGRQPLLPGMVRHLIPAAAVIVVALVFCPSCFPDRPKPSFVTPSDGQQLDGRLDVQVRTRGLMPSDSVVLSRDGVRLGSLDDSAGLTGVWSGFCWPVGRIGATTFQAEAYNPWFSAVCSVSCSVPRARSLLTDLQIQGGQTVIPCLRRFAFYAGHRYDVVLWESSGPWWLTLGQYSRGNDRWDTIMDTTKLVVPADYLSFSPVADESLDVGWKAQEGRHSRFCIFDFLPAGEQ